MTPRSSGPPAPLHRNSVHSNWNRGGSNSPPSPTSAPAQSQKCGAAEATSVRVTLKGHVSGVPLRCTVARVARLGARGGLGFAHGTDFSLAAAGERGVL